MSERIIAVVGPTGSGKTSLSVKIALALGGEVVSMDSMQVYRGMNVGTAKVTESEKKGVEHHLIDVCEPTHSFSCAEYRALAEKAIAEITGRGRVPVLCGGTGLYLDSLLNLDGFSPDVSEGVRLQLDGIPPDELYRRLCQVDPESAENIHPNNVRRVRRALEIYIGTGTPKSEWDRRMARSESGYDALIAFIDFRDRKKLYDSINRRVDVMIENGLEKECAELALDRSCGAAQAIGYKEIYMWTDGKISRDEAIELLKKNTRNYAKRQITWFARYKNAVRFYRDEQDEDEIADRIIGTFRSGGSGK